MIKNILLGILALLILARLFAPTVGTVSISDMNAKLPEFSLQTVDGAGEFSSSELAKGTSLLTFMLYSCPYCTDQSKYLAGAELPFPVYLVSLNEDIEGVKNWQKTNNIKPYYKKFAFNGGELANKLNVSSVPVSFLVKDGIVVKKILGAINDKKLAEINVIIK